MTQDITSEVRDIVIKSYMTMYYKISHEILPLVPMSGQPNQLIITRLKEIQHDIIERIKEITDITDIDPTARTTPETREE